MEGFLRLFVGPGFVAWGVVLEASAVHAAAAFGDRCLAESALLENGDGGAWIGGVEEVVDAVLVVAWVRNWIV